MNKEILLRRFDATFSAFENSIQLFNTNNFNEIPFENSWSAAQVVQHIILASDGFSSVLNGNIAETSRPIDKLLPELDAIFLNFEIKMKSPDFILPKMESYDQHTLLNKVRNIASDIRNAIEKLDLSKTCLDFELPSIGLLTRLEAIYFVIVHTERHTRQLNEIHRVGKK